MNFKAVMLACVVAVGFTSAQSVQANDEFRHTIRIVGSSTVFPFAAFVAEKFYRKNGQQSPVVESTGSGGGIKMFCGGVGTNHPDIVNASRRMKVSELRLCANNNVSAITEVMIGWDGIVLATAKNGKTFNVTRRQLWKALAKRLPFDGQLVENPHKLWSHVDSDLPDSPIQVFGPPPTSGTRDVFVEEVMAKGCRGSDYIENLDEEKRKVICGEMREDGVYVEAGEDDDLIVRRLNNNPKAVGIMGYNAVERRSAYIKAMSIDGIEATFESIQDGVYPLARPLFLYVKDEHLQILPSIKVFLAEFTSETAIGDEGYLVDKGLIPLLDSKGLSVKAQVTKLQTQ
ncbi:substrate-binding domain-containing protein [Terasakiella sp. A23]|uniref:substrate-binding domain-containing protein n=1 Tax=Terasakiella sp. FCG-A23 TaxID=3080561 RepID=UPI00295358DA|nr:substrate-binding domain-containing protein [Terasakiella sp. A23]MDV7340738.1 substrate-binding domain-containing protein [Terasakiella sp. A23]